MTNHLTWKTHIAGVQHHGYKGVVNEIKEGDHLKMIPEPDNKYDKNAVRLVFISKSGRETMIGYVPAKISADISAFLSWADDARCVITSFVPTAKTWDMFKVEITNKPVEEWEDEPDEMEIEDDDDEADNVIDEGGW